MGKCSVCGKKILYNEYKVVKGIVYCLNCKVAKTPIEKVVEEIQEYGIVGFTEKPAPKKRKPRKKSTRRK